MTLTPSAAIYVRQSLDRHGDELAVARQLDQCRRYCAQQGWDVSGEFVDNDRSATTGAERPGFEDLLRARPQRIVVWHVDRLVRLTRDLERVIELGVNVHALKAGHLDLSNPAGRAVARTVTAWATYEGEQKAERQRAKNDQLAEAGLPYRCQRAFGFESDGLTVRESEAEELRSAARAVLQGRSLRSLAQGLNSRGVPTATGRAWNTTTLKAALLSPRNAGLRRHRGAVVGSAAWPAILDDATATAVRVVLSDPSRARGPARRYLLSGIMTCGRCGKPVVGAFVKDGNKGETYRCPEIHVTRKAGPLDEWVMQVVVERLSRPDAAGLFAAQDAGTRLTALRDEQSLTRVRLDALAEAFASGTIDARQLATGSRRLHSDLDRLAGEIASSVVDPTLANVASAESIDDAFRALPLETKRKVLGALMSLELVPIGAGRRAEPAESVRVAWKQS